MATLGVAKHESLLGSAPGDAAASRLTLVPPNHALLHTWWYWGWCQAGASGHLGRSGGSVFDCWPAPDSKHPGCTGLQSICREIPCMSGGKTCLKYHSRTKRCSSWTETDLSLWKLFGTPNSDILIFWFLAHIPETWLSWSTTGSFSSTTMQPLPRWVRPRTKAFSRQAGSVFKCRNVAHQKFCQTVFYSCAQRYGFFSPGTTKKQIKAGRGGSSFEYTSKSQHPCICLGETYETAGRHGQHWLVASAVQWWSMTMLWPIELQARGFKKWFHSKWITICFCCQAQVCGCHQEGDQHGTSYVWPRPNYG